ncbi:MAG: ATP-binding protein [Oscillospiraceae bacterium]|jgi:DNA replication protein DnaC|nr:ATP-binding protein [Oscillospiraceae bacterium]
METLKNLMETLIPQAEKRIPTSYEDWTQRQCDWENAQEGRLSGYDCPACKNRGYVTVIVNGDLRQRTCACMPIRENLRRLKDSGLQDLVERYSFERYIAKEKWQQNTKAKAEHYAANHRGNWFFIGGQVGAGKTHLCTAIVCALIKEGKHAKYMMWREDITAIHARKYRADEYAEMLDLLKTVDVLYIDDFLKCGGGASVPSRDDLNVAHEIINRRYYNDTLLTIISSEYSIDDIMRFDAATGSRIIQRCNGNQVVIQQDENRNYRLSAESKNSEKGKKE